MNNFKKGILRRMGTFVAKCRKAKKITQKKEAKDLKVSVYAIRQVEKGTKMNPPLMKKICSYLEIPTSAVKLKAMRPKDFKNAEGRRYLKVATPVVDALVAYLLKHPAKKRA